MKVDLSQLRRIGEELGGIEHRVQRAIHVARQDVAGASHEAARVIVVDATGLPIAMLKDRVHGESNGVWVDTSELRVSPEYKNPRRVSGGVAVGNRVVAGAFVIRRKSGDLAVLRRVRKGKGGLRDVTIDIHDQVAPRLAARARELERLFFKGFDSEWDRQGRRAS